MATPSLPHRVRVLVATGVTILMLATAAVLTPDQSPALPLETSLVRMATTVQSRLPEQAQVSRHAGPRDGEERRQLARGRGTRCRC